MTSRASSVSGMSALVSGQTWTPAKSPRVRAWLLEPSDDLGPDVLLVETLGLVLGGAGDVGLQLAMSTVGDLFSSHGLAAHTKRHPDARRHPGRRAPPVRRPTATNGPRCARSPRDVGVDPALVIRYFGSKQDLFAAAAEFTARPA